MSFIKRMFVVLVFLGVLAGIAGNVFYFGYVEPKLEVAKAVANMKNLMITNDDFFKRAEQTTIYWDDGTVLARVGDRRYKYVNYSDVNQNVFRAYIANEDNRFYEHNGIDYKAILRASVALVKNKGVVRQGGSTITQQLLKLSVLDDIDGRLERKLVEFYLAPMFESKFSKQDILEFYVNTCFYGNNNTGIRAASVYYFGKEPKDLDLEESVLLASISNSPSKLNLVDGDMERLKLRYTYTLDKMYELGYITEGDCEVAKQREIEHIKPFGVGDKTFYNAEEGLMNYVLSDVARGIDKENSLDIVRAGGFEIGTSLNRDKVEMLQGVLDRHLSKETKLGKDGKYSFQGSISVLDNASGKIIASCGGRSLPDGSKDIFNRSDIGYRQSGSALKPLVVYANAFESGRYTPGSIVKDVPIAKKKGEKTPSNFENKYYGNITMRTALKTSSNVVAYNLLGELGIAECGLKLRELGFKRITDADLGNQGIALGGMEYGVTTNEMVGAYSSLYAEGIYRGGGSIVGVVAPREDLEYNEKEPKRVLSSSAAYMTYSMMQTVLEGGSTGAMFNVKGIDTAGKTGTTNENYDSWFVGITPSYTIAIWLGHDMPKSFAGGWNRTAGIYSDVVKGLYGDGEDSVGFEMPSTVAEVYVNYKGEPVNYNSGRKDLVSTELVSKENEELLNSVVHLSVVFSNLSMVVTPEQYEVAKGLYNKIKSKVDLLSGEQRIKGKEVLKGVDEKAEAIGLIRLFEKSEEIKIKERNIKNMGKFDELNERFNEIEASIPMGDDIALIGVLDEKIDELKKLQYEITSTLNVDRNQQVLNAKVVSLIGALEAKQASMSRESGIEFGEVSGDFL